MSYTITIQPQPQTVTISDIQIIAVRDDFAQQKNLGSNKKLSA